MDASARVFFWYWYASEIGPFSAKKPGVRSSAPPVFTIFFLRAHMRQKRHQIKFYCGDEAYETLQSLKVERNLSMQELIAEAVQILLDQHIQEQQEISQEIEDDIAIDRALEAGTIAFRTVQIQVRKGELVLIRLWQECLSKLPDPTKMALRQLMQDTLRFFMSARLKSGINNSRLKSSSINSSRLRPGIE